jgi:hypothetical protein
MTGSPLLTQAKLAACHAQAARLEAPGSIPSGARELTVHVRSVVELLEETAKVLTIAAKDLEGQQNAPSLEPADDLLAGEFTFLSQDLPSESVGQDHDVATMAAHQLRQKADHLASIAKSTSRRGLTEVVASAVRHIIKATLSVEPALAAAHGLTPRLNPRALIERSLLVRRAYAELRLKMQVIQGSPQEQVAQAHKAIHELVNGPAGPHLREPDRLELLQLANRLEGWRTSAASMASDDAERGRQFVSDALTFAEMLSSVSRRQELVEHDLRCLPQAIDQVRALIASGRPILRGHLEAVRGVDDTIERLLAPGQAIDPSLVLLHLKRAHSERRTAAGRATSDTIEAEELRRKEGQ